MGTYERTRDLFVQVDGYELERHELAVSSSFTRVTTVIRMRGAGCEGSGEDVTYSSSDQEAQLAAGVVHSLSGSYTFDEFSRYLDTLELFPNGPDLPASRDYRRWAYESAAMDLALRQGGLSLASALGRETRPVRFVVSMRLPDPPSTKQVVDLVARYPNTRFKLDPEPAWTRELMQQLAELGIVDTLDLKGHYEGTVVDMAPDPELYRNVAEAFPDAWIEDPRLTSETEPVLAPYQDRLTFDAPVHSVADIEALPFVPRVLNFKPSRFGTWRRLLDAYDWCEARGVGGYGGGQFELSVGRTHIQYLASLFHADAPNDVAPAGYNAAEPADGLPETPLAFVPAATGFRIDDSIG